MTKSELIEALATRQGHLAFNDVELSVKSVMEQMSHALANGERIEIRGFGSFSLHYRPPRMGRNPKTGSAVGSAGQACAAFQARQGIARTREFAGSTESRETGLGRPCGFGSKIGPTRSDTSDCAGCAALILMDTPHSG